MVLLVANWVRSITHKLQNVFFEAIQDSSQNLNLKNGSILLDAFDLARSHKDGLVIAQNGVKWDMCLHGWVKLNSDAVIRIFQKGAWLGFVVRDSVGKVLFASAAFKPFCVDVELVEAQVLAEGLARVIEEGFSKVEAKCDSLNVAVSINLGEHFLSGLADFLMILSSLVQRSRYVRATSLERPSLFMRYRLLL